MIRLLNLLMLGMAYTCVGTVLAQAVGLGYLWTQGMLAGDRLVPALAALHGVDPHLEIARDTPPSDDAGPDPPTAAEMASARLGRQLDLDLREQALGKALAELRNLQAGLRTERDRFDKQYDSFKSELDRLRRSMTDESIAEVQRTLEAIDPKQAKDQLLRMFSDTNVSPEQAMLRVVSIVKAMAIEKRKKVLAEFRTKEEGDQLAAILKQIGDGVPETALLDDARRRLEDLAPRGR